MANEATVLDQQARLLAPELHRQFTAAVVADFPVRAASWNDLPDEEIAGYQGLAMWILVHPQLINEYLRPILDEAAREATRYTGPVKIELTEAQMHQFGLNPGHVHCPDCGCDANDHSLHAEGCPRIGTPAQHELNQ